MTTKPLPCSCCNASTAALHRGNDGVIRLVIVARHHGTQHGTAYTLEQLEQLVREFKEAEQHDRAPNLDNALS